MLLDGVHWNYGEKVRKKIFGGEIKQKISSSFFKLCTTFKINRPITISFYISSESQVNNMIELRVKFHYSKVKLEIMHAPSRTSLNSTSSINCVFYHYISQIDPLLLVILDSSVDRTSAP